jgi:hypothetical protein
VNRTESVQNRQRSEVTAKDTETMVGNGIATALVLTAAVLAVIGLLVGFDVINTDNPFDNGMLWLASAITSAIASNAFRREHHITDPREYAYRDRDVR